MPPPPAVFFLAGPAATAATVAACKKAAIGTVDAALAFTLSRLAWKQVPDWIREDVAVQNLFVSSGKKQNRRRSSSSSSGGNGGSGSDLSSLASVIEKLQALVDSASQKLNANNNSNDNGTATVPFLHASVLAFIQLSAQYRRLYPQIRNDWYAQCGTTNKKHHRGASTSPTSDDDTKTTLFQLGENSSVAVTMKMAMDFAVWAYESDTDKLQQWLLHSYSPSPSSSLESSSSTSHDDENDNEDFVILPDSNQDDDYYDGGGYIVRQHNTLVAGAGRTVRPGYVGHYVAVSNRQRTVIVGVRGTSTLEDLLTDCCGRAITLSDHDHIDGTDTHLSVEVQASKSHEILDNNNDGSCSSNADEEEADNNGIEVISGHERILIKEHDEQNEHSDDAIRCHEGILICAKRLVNTIQSLVEEYVVDNGYDLLLAGHSLGAGVASMAAFLLRSRWPILATSDRVHVAAFAPPPILDHDTALAASSYITSIVYNSDLIPRASLVNLAVCLEVLRTISQRLQDRKLAPKNPSSTAALIRKLSQNLDNVHPDDLLLSRQEFTSVLDMAHQKVQVREPDHLYIPGRVIMMYENWEASSTCDEDGPAGNEGGLLEVMETDGCAPVLRFLEVDALRMVTDHVTSSYYDAIDRLSSLGRRTSSAQS